MPGVILVPETLAIGQAVDELVLVIEAGDPDDFDGQVTFIPLG